MITFLNALFLLFTVSAFSQIQTVERKFKFPDLQWAIAIASNPLCLVIYTSLDFASTSKKLGKNWRKYNNFQQKSNKSYYRKMKR